MDLSKILSISGKPGLYKMITSTKNGVLVESLIDEKRIPAFSHERISSLEEISVFTETEDVPLKEIFHSIFNITNNQQALSHKSSANELVGFFESVLPNFDRDRVYASDIKKIIQWYNLLQTKGLVDLAEDVEAEESDTDSKENEKE
ncbi:MAG: DUF5606 domain-containing protein [Bacteroidales bacterium]|jgi:hypothetical protein|nr:DUF5606 domain-containing protein [Bacteroidales bacterium]